MAASSLPNNQVTQPEKKQWISGHAKRRLRENLTAYLFLFPALLVIFSFGIFPIFFAGYVSLYKWRIRQGEYLGLSNYVRAMGSLAYVFFFLLAFALIAVGVVTAWKAVQDSKEKSVPLHFPLLSLIPGAIITLGIGQIILRFITFFVQERAIEAGEARVLGNVGLGILLILAGAAINVVIGRIQHKVAAKTQHTVLPNFGMPAISTVLSIGIGVLMLFFTVRELQAAEDYTIAFGRVQSTLLGLVLLAAGYFIWTWGARQASNIKLLGSIIGASVMLGAAYFFAIRWPEISEGSSEDFLQSLSVTIWYAVLTVPVQLSIALILAYLLYQNIRAKGLFRIIFFIPYIAPAVATAGIFRFLFSLRDGSFANRFVNGTGGASMKWLQEAASTVQSFAESYGVPGAENWEVGGPSLALFVIILYNIWVYVGYDTVIFLAGLGQIPGTLYEAARIDGAGRWQIFRHITVPLLSPTTYFLSVISVIGTFKAFSHIWILRQPAAQGTGDTASVHFFETFLRQSRFGYATSMAIVLFVIIIVMTLIQQRIAAKRVFSG